MKNDLKFFPLYVLWVVSSRNDTGNNGTNGKVSKNSTFSQYWGGGLEFERGVWGGDFGFVLRVLEFGGGGFDLGVGIRSSRVRGLGGGFVVWV